MSPATRAALESAKNLLEQLYGVVCEEDCIEIEHVLGLIDKAREEQQ